MFSIQIVILIFLLKKSGYRPYTVYRGAVLNNTASGCKLGVYPDTVPSKYLDILEHTAKLYLIVSIIRPLTGNEFAVFRGANGDYSFLSNYLCTIAGIHAAICIWGQHSMCLINVKNQPSSLKCCPSVLKYSIVQQRHLPNS